MACAAVRLLVERLRGEEGRGPLLRFPYDIIARVSDAAVSPRG